MGRPMSSKEAAKKIYLTNTTMLLESVVNKKNFKRSTKPSGSINVTSRQAPSELTEDVTSSVRPLGVQAQTHTLKSNYKSITDS